MSFLTTPEEALPCAERLLTHLRAEGGSVLIEQAAWPDSPYRTTLHRISGTDVTLYEVQGHLNFHGRLQNFTEWLWARRYSVELFLVAKESSPATGQLFGELKRYGVGLMLLQDDGHFNCSIPAKNPALQVTLDPSLRFGEMKRDILSCIAKFNEGQRKDGLRDLCELVERETERVLVRASQKGWLSLSAKDIQQKDWSDQINALGSSNITTGGRSALIDSKLKDDLQSFRGARNLIDHKVRSRRDEQRRRRQFGERMLMGARLIGELAELRRRIR